MRIFCSICFGMVLILSSIEGLSQSVHGPSIKSGYSSLEEFSFGVGYHFIKFKDDWGWERPSHNYYIEYIPEFDALGVSANIQYTFIFFKGGFEASFRSNNPNNDAYFTFFPNIGFELVNIDISLGPEFVSTRIDNKTTGFKLSLKAHPKLFNKGTKRLVLKRK